MKNNLARRLKQAYLAKKMILPIFWKKEKQTDCDEKLRIIDNKLTSNKMKHEKANKKLII